MSEGTVAVLGASKDRAKYGNKAVRAYAKKGWTVYPVNLTASEIEALKAYKSVRALPSPIDRITVYLPPSIGLTVLEDIAAIKAREIFLNPGADAPEVIAKAQSLGLKVIVACSIVDIGMSPAQFP